MKDEFHKLLHISPFDFSDNAKSLYVNLLKQELLHHRTNSNEISNLYNFYGFSIQDVLYENISEIPYLHVNVLKTHDLSVVPVESIELTLCSSGTSGQKSQIKLDKVSLDRIKKIAFNVFNDIGLVDESESVNYVLFSYDPKIANDVGTSFSDELTTHITKRKNVYYAFKWNSLKNEFEFDLAETTKKLHEFASGDEPVRLLGFPAFVNRVLKNYKEYFGSQKIRNSSRSFVITGGGWKTLENEKISQSEFREILNEVLGIPIENIRDSYGFVEHGIPYMECKKHKFHIPNIANVFARNPSDLSVCKFGEEGILHFVSPYIHSYPSISLLSTDFGIVREKCNCGLGGHILEITGRAGKTKHKGCAFKAEELLK